MWTHFISGLISTALTFSLIAGLGLQVLGVLAIFTKDTIEQKRYLALLILVGLAMTTTSIHFILA